MDNVINISTKIEINGQIIEIDPTRLDSDVIGMRRMIIAAKEIADASTYKDIRYKQLSSMVDIFNSGLPLYDIKEMMKAFYRGAVHELTCLGGDRHILYDLDEVLWDLEGQYYH